MNAAEIKVAVGDIVERLYPSHRKYVRGRVVGITPRGRARVRVTHRQDRFWRVTAVRVIQLMPREPELVAVEPVIPTLARRDIALELAGHISMPSVIGEIDAALAMLDREDEQLRLLRKVAVSYHERMRA
jgi:hypothetical protein